MGSDEMQQFHLGLIDLLQLWIVGQIEIIVAIFAFVIGNAEAFQHCFELFTVILRCRQVRQFLPEYWAIRTPAFLVPDHVVLVCPDPKIDRVNWFEPDQSTLLF